MNRSRRGQWSNLRGAADVLRPRCSGSHCISWRGGRGKSRFLNRFFLVLLYSVWGRSSLERTALVAMATGPSPSPIRFLSWMKQRKRVYRSEEGCRGCNLFWSLHHARNFKGWHFALNGCSYWNQISHCSGKILYHTIVQRNTHTTAVSRYVVIRSHVLPNMPVIDWNPSQSRTREVAYNPMTVTSWVYSCVLEIA